MWQRKRCKPENPFSIRLSLRKCRLLDSESVVIPRPNAKRSSLRSQGAPRKVILVGINQ
jgi:hypothetical protein